MQRKLLKIALLSLLLSAASLMASCSNDTDGGSGNTAEGIEVEVALRSAVNAYNQGDLDTFLTYWTDEGLRSEFGATRDEIRAAGEDILDGDARELERFAGTDVNGNSASTEATFTVGMTAQKARYELVRDAGVWKINDSETMAPDLAVGVTTIEVSMTEFSFDFDESRIVDGNLAFRASNDGDQVHELILTKIPLGFDLDAALRSEETPEGVEIIGGVGEVKPGTEGWVAPIAALPAGDYIFFCFLPDEEDPEATSHVLKGMHARFKVQESMPVSTPVR